MVPCVDWVYVSDKLGYAAVVGEACFLDCAV